MSRKYKISYSYNALGNRLRKAVDIPNNIAADYTVYTVYFVYDASGNVMATYNKDDTVHRTL